MMKKYFRKIYYHGDRFELYDEGFNLVEVTGVAPVGLIEVAKRSDNVTALREYEPINDEWVLLKERHKLTDEQIENIHENMGITIKKNTSGKTELNVKVDGKDIWGDIRANTPTEVGMLLVGAFRHAKEAFIAFGMPQEGVSELIKKIYETWEQSDKPIDIDEVS